MQITRRLLLAAAATALLASGCHCIKDTASTAATGTYPAAQYYTANFSAATQGYTAVGQIRIKTDSIIWISATKTVELARAQFTADSALIYAKMTNGYFQGTYDELAKRFGYHTTFEDLHTMLLSDDAEKLLNDAIDSLSLDATIRLQPLKNVEQTTFPFYIPPTARPL